MAWQSGMAGNGGMGSGGMDGGGMGHQQATEYTLQGVMRFLQTEWHRHERERNAWEIERGEMRSRIGRLEGDSRTAKHLQESLTKHIKILEIALKKEREKVRKLTNGENVDAGKDPKEAAKESLEALAKQQGKPLTVGLENEEANPDTQEEPERDQSRSFLGKCSQELFYHVLQGAQPAVDVNESPEMMHLAQRMQRQNLEDSYPQQQQAQQQQMIQQQNHVDMVREPSRQSMMTGYAENRMQPSGPRHERLHGQHQIHSTDNGHISMPPNDVPREGQRFEGPPKETPGQPGDEVLDEADGWNFDDGPVTETIPPPQPTQRPDMDAFPNADISSSKSPPRSGPGSHRRKSSGSRRRSEGKSDVRELAGQKAEPSNFKVRFALRGHLDVVRSVIFTGGGSPSEPEICTAGDDGTIKRWIIPATYGAFGPNMTAGNDLDVTSYFTHRGHSGAVTCLAACSPSQDFSNGGRALGDGWVFSGGQDASIKVWERGRVDPKASLDGHTDAVWALNVLPTTAGSVFGEKAAHYGGADRILLVSGAADGRILIWAVSAAPQLSSPPTASRGARSGSRRANSISSGSNFPSSPQPNTSSSTPFHYTLVHNIMGKESVSPTCISPLSLAGINFVVSFTDASVLVYDTRTGEQIVGMASLETYDGTRATGVNSVVATTIGFDGTADLEPGRAMAEEETVHGATGSSGGVEGIVISGYEDRYIRFFDANSGQCTYTMLAHPSAISSLSLSPDGRELVSAGHDASLRFWSLEKRSCTQEITSHRLMRGEGVCSVIWSKDGRWVVSGGGDGVVKVFAR